MYKYRAADVDVNVNVSTHLWTSIYYLAHNGVILSEAMAMIWYHYSLHFTALHFVIAVDNGQTSRINRVAVVCIEL